MNGPSASFDASQASAAAIGRAKPNKEMPMPRMLPPSAMSARMTSGAPTASYGLIVAARPNSKPHSKGRRIRPCGHRVATSAIGRNRQDGQKVALQERGRAAAKVVERVPDHEGRRYYPVYLRKEGPRRRKHKRQEDEVDHGEGDVAGSEQPDYHRLEGEGPRHDRLEEVPIRNAPEPDDQQ